MICYGNNSLSIAILRGGFFWTGHFQNWLFLRRFATEISARIHFFQNCDWVNAVWHAISSERVRARETVLHAVSSCMPMQYAQNRVGRVFVSNTVAHSHDANHVSYIPSSAWIPRMPRSSVCAPLGKYVSISCEHCCSIAMRKWNAAKILGACFSVDLNLGQRIFCSFSSHVHSFDRSFISFVFLWLCNFFHYLSLSLPLPLGASHCMHACVCATACELQYVLKWTCSFFSTSTSSLLLALFPSIYYTHLVATSCLFVHASFNAFLHDRITTICVACVHEVAKCVCGLFLFAAKKTTTTK